MTDSDILDWLADAGDLDAPLDLAWVLARRGLVMMIGDLEGDFFDGDAHAHCVRALLEAGGVADVEVSDAVGDDGVLVHTRGPRGSACWLQRYPGLSEWAHEALIVRAAQAELTLAGKQARVVKLATGDQRGLYACVPAAIATLLRRRGRLGADDVEPLEAHDLEEVSEEEAAALVTGWTAAAARERAYAAASAPGARPAAPPVEASGAEFERVVAEALAESRAHEQRVARRAQRAYLILSVVIVGAALLWALAALA